MTSFQENVFKYGARTARIGNHILSFIAGLLIVLLLSYGGYSLWDTYRIHNHALGGELKKMKPGHHSVNNEMDFAALRKINPDVKAWITLDDTHIDYPIVQGRTDMEYINKDVYGNFSLSGAIFQSVYNKEDFSDRYNLTYGHHMENGAMYGDLEKLLKKDFLEQHHSGTLYLPDRTYRIELYAAIKCDAYENRIYNTEAVQSDMNALQTYARQNAEAYREIGMKDSDRVISMTTCSDTNTLGRTVVLGKLITENGEAP